MNTRPFEIVGFVAVLIGLFVWSGEVITRASGATQSAVGQGVSTENGEAIFWSFGKCHTCHAVGARGRSVRGPNLGESAVGPQIAVRAEARANERTADGNPQNATDYLVESLTAPSAYVTGGFRDEMPVIYEPPIGLTPDEITSVVLYLQSLGGVPDARSIRLPQAVFSTRRDGGTDWEPYLAGDTARGRELFFDAEGDAACVTCHRVGDRGGEVGPDLSSIAGVRSPRFIMEALVQPSASIASGFETTLIETVTGRRYDGIVIRETGDSVWLRTKPGDQIGFALSDISRRRTLDVSIMPEDIGTNLTVAELHDLMAFLRTLE